MQMRHLHDFSSRLPRVLRTFVRSAILVSGILSCVAVAAPVVINNTATVSYVDVQGVPQSDPSNTIVTPLIPSDTPGVVTFYQFVPPASSGNAGNVFFQFDGSEFDDGGAGNFQPLPGNFQPLPVGGVSGPSISLVGPVEVRPTSVFHISEPVFITLADANRNLDPAVREFIEVRVTTSTGDVEILRLQETGPNTGIFAAVVQSVGSTQPSNSFDGKLTLEIDGTIRVDYQDPYYPADRSSTNALVDPFGILFDSQTGAPINGATVTIINTATNLPATVFADDGVSCYPSSVTTGQAFTNTGCDNLSYTVPAGGFRFPFVAPGNYRFVVTPVGGYTVPSSVAAGSLPLDPNGNPYAIVAGSYSDVFVVVPGPALNIDIPADPATGGLLLQMSVSRADVSVGDVVQYRLVLQNVSTVQTAFTPVITDILPKGVRFVPGSLKINGVVQPDPIVSADGETLTITLADILSGGQSVITYVAEIGAGTAIGNIVNNATAIASGGVMVSNKASVEVLVREAFISGRFTIIGRVFEGGCAADWSSLKGVPDVRVMMEDGTYVITDKDGQYHFEAVRPGTHVVQVDTASLPKGYEPLSCIENTRFAGRSFSQFVDVKGGGLWRADFHTKAPAEVVVVPVPAEKAVVGIKASSTFDLEEVTIKARPAEVKSYNLRAEFDSCRATLKPEGEIDVKKLADQLDGQDVERIELIGNTDNQRLSARCRQVFADNYVLSEARARTVGDALAGILGLSPEQISTSGRGPDAPVANNATPQGMARNRRTEVVVHSRTRVTEKDRTEQRVRAMRHRLDVDGSSAVGALKIMAMLPANTRYVSGSATVDGKSVNDPVVDDSLATFVLDAISEERWSRVIEFRTLPVSESVSPAKAPEKVAPEAVVNPLSACSVGLQEEGAEAVRKLVTEWKGKSIKQIEFTGYTDDQPLNDACQAEFQSLEGLSRARALVMAETASMMLNLHLDQVVVLGRGAADPIADNASAEMRQRNNRIEVKVVAAGNEASSEPSAPLVVTQKAADASAVTPVTPAKPAEIVKNDPVVCKAGNYELKAMASFQAAGEVRGQTPATSTQLTCPGARSDQVYTAVASNDGERREAEFDRPIKVVDTRDASTVARESKLDDVEAAGGANKNWTEGEKPGMAWLFPSESYNPRSPSARVAIKHAPDHKVVLRSANGQPVSALNFEGISYNADRTVAVSVWRAVPLEEGANKLKAEVVNARGDIAGRFEQTVHFSNTPVRAEFVPERSVLVADGLNKPVLAIRLLDRNGHPIRSGVTGPIEILEPYRTSQQAEFEQKRQLAGMDRFQPQYRVDGDEGIAYVELAPTTDSGTVQANLTFRVSDETTRRQEIRAWLEPHARDWVVVGFAEGTVGYNTLKNNAQPLVDQGMEDGGYADGQISLYAKGRVTGKWLLTMAFDSDKSDQRDRQRSLLGSIDPDQYYTLYGDGTGQRNDAPSQDNLYLKIERGQFYALFGDYETGLSKARLMRYSRTLNGLKVEKGDGLITFTAFAAETPQSFARDEIQGNGTSGLYALSKRGIVLNSEKVRIETRDRLNSFSILESRTLTPNLDYDIDYAAGTLFFRQPINSRDTNFNPIFIVTEYETLGIASNDINAGGRVAINLLNDRVAVGVSAVREESSLGKTDLTGADITVKLPGDTELRLEGAGSDGQQATVSRSGDAWLAELEHHNGKIDLLAYARRQDSDFGVNQQSISESGQQKLGVETQYRLDKDWSLLGEIYNQESLSTQNTREAAIAKVQYKVPAGGFGVGVQAINDKAGSGALVGQEFTSEQMTATANRFFFNRKLELSAQAEAAVGGNRDSIDFPNRYVLGAGYAINDHARLLAGQEFTDGGAFDTSTSRVGVQVMPWKGARLDTTLNQSSMSEYGPRTFGQMGLTQAVLLGERWGLDFSADASRTFNESTQAPVIINPNYPVAPGGTLTAGTTEDYNAFSAGATYRQDIWSWNGRAETRNGETTDRYGFTSNFLRQAQAGVAFSTSAQLFRTEQVSGNDGLLASLDLSWAWRPLGVHWSVLDRLEFRYEDVDNGTGLVGSGLFGQNSLTAFDASSRRIINNLAINRVSREWTQKDREGNLFRRYERNQWSLFYGAKYALDTIDGDEYSGFTDMLGVEVRHDINPKLDIGVQASVLNSWSTGTHAYAFGPMVGISPVTNGWITLGYNVRGFVDTDFDAARYTGQGPYLQLRFKFDQNSFKGSSEGQATHMSKVQAP